MIEKLLKHKFWLFLAHILIGFLMTYPSVSKFFGIIIILLGTYDIFTSKNRNNQVIFWATYLVSLEVLLRMTKGVIFWETVKYSFILYCIIGLFTEEKQHTVSVIFIFYLLLLSVGMFFTNIPAGESFRKAWLFNLSGPIALGVAAMFFFKRKISMHQAKEIMYFSLLPIISMMVLLYFRTPSLKEITFQTQANFVTSGGYGPNQVSTILGYGAFLMAVLMLLKHKITGFILLDILVLFYILYRGLITFSRGGMITAILAFIIFIGFYLLYKGQIKVFLQSFGVMIALIVSVWIFSANLTGGLLINRYLGQNSFGDRKADVTSGRLDILNEQWNSFYDHPFFGIGVGSGKYKRLEDYDGHVVGTSHNEMGRLIEEHGIIGLLALSMIILISLKNSFSQKTFFKGFLLACLAFWFLTINHSAMRVAFPSFIYGLSLINITSDKEEEEDE